MRKEGKGFKNELNSPKTHSVGQNLGPREERKRRLVFENKKKYSFGQNLRRKESECQKVGVIYNFVNPTVPKFCPK